MSHFLLSTVRDPRLHEVAPGFLYSATPPTHPRNARDLIVFMNGSFANLGKLRSTLQHSHLTPEEILAAFYLANRGFSAISGYYSAVIVDLRRRAIVGITDRQCVGELYYHTGRQNEITIASRFMDLLPYSRKHINEYALACFFALADGGIDRRDTLVADIERIAQFYTLHFDGTLTITDDYLATLSSIPERSGSYDDLLDELELLLRNHIRTLTQEYGPICNSLSGGKDSSYLQALLLEQQHTHSFSIAYDVFGQDNSYATDVARYLGTTHEALTFNANDFLKYIEQGIKVTSKPYMYQGETMFFKLYERVASRFPNTTIITGHGADSSFDGEVPGPIRIALRLNLLPRQLLDWVLGYLSPDWGGITAELRARTISSEGLARIARQTSTCQRVARYLGHSYDVYADTVTVANRLMGDKEHRLGKAHLFGSGMRRTPSVLHGLAGSVGLRVVSPFLEPEFLEYTLTIPAKLKRRKVLVKRLALRHLPREYVDRPKIGKGVPYAQLFAQDEQWIDRLNAIKRAQYYGFDVDEMLTDRQFLLLLRLVNFDIWKRHVLDAG